MSLGITKLEGVITEDFIEEISALLAENKRIRRNLPDHGRIHIDRKLPFLCIYRRPLSRNDNGTDKLVTGEASYLVASAAPKYKSGNSSLVKAVVETFAKDTNAFLILEIWSSDSPISIFNQDTGRTAPSFRIFVPENRIPVETIESIETALKRITISRKRGVVTTVYTKKPWPEKLSSILTASDILKYNCYQVGLEISPIYRDPDSHETYPLVLKSLHRGLSLALKKGAYEFSKKRTATKPESYKSLGRHAVVKAVWEVDQKLAEISTEFDFLMLVTPVNIEQSWRKFKSNRFEQDPLFYYRPVSFDPSVLKRRLYEIPFDRIEDPLISSIFHEKLVELELQFSMIRDRNTRNFFFGSMQLYGEMDNELVDLSKRILNDLSPRSRQSDRGRIINAKLFAERAREEIGIYRKVVPDITSKVIIRDDITGLMVSNGNLFIGKRTQIHESRVEALIQHEVGTHVLTYANGINQPFQQLYCGLAGSDELQEGIAVLSEYLVGGLSTRRFRLLAGRVMAAKMLIDGATFVETFRELHSTYGFTQKTAYTISSRIFRSGGFTKDAIYLRGLVNLIKYLRKGGEVGPLLVGKISIDDLPFVFELQCRRILKPPLLTPQYLYNQKSVAKLAKLKQGELIFNLI